MPEAHRLSTGLIILMVSTRFISAAEAVDSPAAVAAALHCLRVGMVSPAADYWGYQRSVPISGHDDRGHTCIEHNPYHTVAG